MKRLFTISLFVLLTTCLFAQVPQAINFQAIARDGSGNPMVNTNLQIRLSVMNNEQGSDIVYQELRALQTNTYGSFSFQIGVNPSFITLGTFQGIDWTTGNKHLKIDYDPTNTFTFSLTLGVIKFVSVPFAFAAQEVMYIDASGAQNGDALIFNSASGKFEPGQAGITSVAWGDVLNKPVFSAVSNSGNYTDLINKPTIPTQYTDAMADSRVIAGITNKVDKVSGKGLSTNDYTTAEQTKLTGIASGAEVNVNADWNSTTGDSKIVNKPTTLAGFGITDAMNTAHSANGITATNITNWSAAYGWGNHAGLYRPISYVPAWSEITGNPIAITAPVNNQLLKYNSTTGKWENWTPNYLTGYTETDPIWTIASANYYTKTNMQTNGQSQLSWSNLINIPPILDLDKTDDVTITGVQTITGNKIFSGTVSVNLPVNNTDAVNKSYVDLLLARIEALEIATGIKVKDIDGNLYNTVTIGTQTWMVENLKVTHYRNGDPIPNVTDQTAWEALTSGSYCWYNNNIANKNSPYGALYNWHTVNTGKLAPAGWHVPTDAEWTQLEMALGMNQADLDVASPGPRGTDQGTQLKNTIGWADNGNGTNTSGFSALPGGLRTIYFGNLGYVGYWWSATEERPAFAWNRYLYGQYTNVHRLNADKTHGFSVRCIKD